MNIEYKAAPEAAQRNRARRCVKKQSVTARWAVATTFLVQSLLFSGSAQAGLFQPDPVPLQQFGIASAGRIYLEEDIIRFYNLTKLVLGSKAIVRNGLVWDPTTQNNPDFARWSAKQLELARERDIIVLPVITTNNFSAGGYRMPTDAQWTYGLRQIVRMYGPGGVYQKGGTYVYSGRTVTVAPHPSFAGLTDIQIWNEPNAEGNLSGAMTPARIVQLTKIGSAAMREEANKLGFKLNVIGPPIALIDLDYLGKLLAVDSNYLSYADTQTFHAYSRFSPSQCDAFGSSRKNCIKTFEEVRKYLNAHGGTNVHLGVTEAGTAGDRGTCTGPQVRSEELSATINAENLLWLRARPYLKMDFWISTFLIDSTKKYSYACDSGIYDIPYWESKLGLFRADLSMKPWGAKYRDLLNFWRQ